MPSAGSDRDARAGCLCCSNLRVVLLAQFGDPILQRPQADPQHLGGEFAIAANVSRVSLM